MGSPATSPHPKTSYRLRNRPKKKKKAVIEKELSKTFIPSHIAAFKH